MCYRLIKLRYFAFVFFVFCCFTAAAQQNSYNAILKRIKQFKSKDSVEIYVSGLLKTARSQHDELLEARVLLAHSFKVYMNGDEVRALNLAYQANKLTNDKDSVTYTKAATMIAYMLGRRGKNVEALNTAFDILRKVEQKGWPKQQLECLNCIADLYRTMDEPQKALPYALKSAKVAQALKDTALYMLSISSLSNLYSARSMGAQFNLPLAAQYLEQLLNGPYSKRVTTYNKAQYLSNLGRIYEMQDKLEKAEGVLKQALELSRSENFAGIEKHALNELMTCEVDMGHYKQAIEYGHAALAAQTDAQSSRRQVRNIFYQFSRAYAGMGDYKVALNYTTKAQAILDSLNAVEKVNAATELEERYKADKRLIVADNQARLATLQRNFIVAISITILFGIIAIYRWFAYKGKKEKLLLQERHRQLAHLDAMKSRFFANISHELRTPLTLIMGPAEQLLYEHDIDEQQKKSYLKSVYRNSKKLLELVNELLALGKVDAGTLALKLKTIDIAWFVNIIYQGFASAAAFKNIHYTLSNTIEGQVLVQLDADKFEKIANNLLSNAIKFTPAGRSVNVVAAITGSTIEFTVTDTGKGIAADELPHVFERYYQGKQQDDTGAGGTGIGLAIAREFCDLMSGSITVNSMPGVGSTFKVTVPKIAASTGDVPEHYIPMPEDAIEIAQGQGEKLVMLVEDHREMAQYISYIVKPFYRVLMAGNGREALEILKTLTELPDLIVTDVMMPEMDGFTLLGHLKSDATFCRIPVIVLTALGDDQNKLKALNTGVDDYLTKPFVANQLLARVNNLISNAAGRYVLSPQDETEMDAVADKDADDAFKPIMAVSPADMLWLTQLEALVRKYIGKTDLNIALLSYDMAISERQLFRRIKSITGVTPNLYIRTIRLQIAREAIESGKYRTISEISHVAGFDTPAYFSKLFKEQYGRDVNELL